MANSFRQAWEQGCVHEGLPPELLGQPGQKGALARKHVALPWGLQALANPLSLSLSLSHTHMHTHMHTVPNIFDSWLTHMNGTHIWGSRGSV